MMESTLEPEVTLCQELIVLPLAVTLGSMQGTEILPDFAKRLNELCDDMGVPPKGKNRQAAVAKVFNVSQKSACKWLQGAGWRDLARYL